MLQTLFVTFRCVAVGSRGRWYDRVVAGLDWSTNTRTQPHSLQRKGFVEAAGEGRGFEPAIMESILIHLPRGKEGAKCARSCLVADKHNCCEQKYIPD